jgi:ribosome-binding factor A
MAHRPEQYASLLKKEISLFIERSISRPVGVFLSVTNVELAAKDTTAKVYISIYPDEKGDEIFATLKPYESEARGYLGRMIKHRNMPYIIFVHDRGQEARLRLEKLLENGDNKTTT